MEEDGSSGTKKRQGNDRGSMVCVYGDGSWVVGYDGLVEDGGWHRRCSIHNIGRYDYRMTIV